MSPCIRNRGHGECLNLAGGTGRDAAQNSPFAAAFWLSRQIPSRSKRRPDFSAQVWCNLFQEEHNAFDSIYVYARRPEVIGRASASPEKSSHWLPGPAETKFV